MPIDDPARPDTTEKPTSPPPRPGAADAAVNPASRPSRPGAADAAEAAVNPASRPSRPGAVNAAEAAVNPASRPSRPGAADAAEAAVNPASPPPRPSAVDATGAIDAIDPAETFGAAGAAGTPPSPPSPPSRPTAWTALRPLLLRLHFTAGLLTAPFLLVAALSGLLYALSFQAEKVAYAHELSVPVGDTVLPLDRQVGIARAANPDGTVTAVWPGAEPGATTRVLMADPDAPEGTSLAVFVDPYTGDVRGRLPSYGSSGALPLRTWIDGLHRDLHLGEPGRIYSELAASWLFVLVLGGLALWFARRRTRRRALLLPERGPRSRRRTLSWHGSVGLWAALGLLLLSATGLTWSRYAGENIGALQDGLGGATPTLSAGTAGVAGGEHAGHGPGHQPADPAPAPPTADIGVDRAVDAARAAGIDSASIAVTLPADGRGYVVKETDKQFPVELDQVAVDPADGTVLDRLDFAEYPLLAKLTRIGIDAHTGVFLGLFNQLALAALALALALMILWGYRMWWLRRPRRPVGRAAWRKLPVTLLLPLAAAAALLGWFVPLLGLSLLVLLAAELVLALVTRNRNRIRIRRARTR
ncbi:PepSY domain-containing protein [Streptomyces sp. R302]|uniref:PepSY-associated TM helix domain-containing protein n=1 Tax=unclassified Streptomyces TaxID=2593676 RepID=UPI00145DA147|nr:MULTISPECIES: PepSY domain-containing protein [unclassified Streptomyces]NML49495.1 PepSY domain-containing protein [Streptomyces sp. R301]NML77822.1 PepSY domain-containing protein [Streptomyces sp. R302]